MASRKKIRRRNPLSKIKRFYLERKEDVSKVSGTGVIAVGVQFPDKKAIMQWQTAIKSVVIYDSVENLIKVHGHDGKTVLKWLD